MKRIVIADDSSTARLFIRRCLKTAGLENASIVFSTNGQEALDLLKSESADLLITDLNMPVMDGETLLKWLKADPKLSGIPVLVITSAVNPAKETELVQAGAFGVLSKPVTPAAMVDKIKFLL